MAGMGWPRDELEELRVSIIEGDIPGQGPGYSVHVGLDAQALFERYKKMGFATDRDLLVAPGEISRQNVPNSPQLAAFSGLRAECLQVVRRVYWARAGMMVCSVRRRPAAMAARPARVR